MTNEPGSRRAWVYTSRGSPSSILALTSLPIPDFIPPEHVEIRVSYAALNQGTLYQMALIPTRMRHAPTIAEMDLSGVITRTGTGDDPRLSVGDRVAAMLPASYALSSGEGALTEVVVVPANCVVKLTDKVRLADAAGCLLVGMTAWQQVVEAQVKTGDRVLVNAASGGIGSMVVQMTRRIVGDDGVIVGICSGINGETVKSLGADEVMDYTKSTNLPEELANTYGEQLFDAIIDTIGHQNLYLASPSYLAPDGIYSSVGIKPPAYNIPSFLRAVLQMKLNEWWPISTWLGGVGRWWRGVSMMNPTLEDRKRIIAMLERGDVRVVTDSVWALEDVKEAYEKLAGMHAKGKILVHINKEPDHPTPGRG